MILKNITGAEADGKAYVHWKSWQESYRGIVDDAYPDTGMIQTLHMGKPVTAIRMVMEK